jgi:SAM-dependent methyltransferase
MTATRARWAAAIEARARAHWTDERTAQLLGDKHLVIRPAEGAVLLRALGLLRDDGSLPPAQARKYFQINHMVALLGPALHVLRSRHRAIRLLDVGCGRSYLTLLLAWCAREVWNHPLEVLGVDRDPSVVAEARRRADLAGLADAVRFEVGDAAALADRDVHGVVAPCVRCGHVRRTRVRDPDPRGPARGRAVLPGRARARLGGARRAR